MSWVKKNLGDISQHIECLHGLVLNLHDIEKKWGYTLNDEGTDFRFYSHSLSNDYLSEAQEESMKSVYRKAQGILQGVRNSFLEQHSSALLILHDYFNWMIERSLADGGPIVDGYIYVKFGHYQRAGFNNRPRFLFNTHNIPRLCIRAFDNMGFKDQMIPECDYPYPTRILEQNTHIKNLITQDAIAKKFLATEELSGDRLKIYVTSMQTLLSQQEAMLVVLESAGKRTAKKDILRNYVDSLSGSSNTTSIFASLWGESKSKKLEMARALYHGISNEQDVTEVTRQIMSMRSRDLKQLVTTLPSLADPVPTDLLGLSDEAFKSAVSIQDLHKYLSLHSDEERKALLMQKVDTADCVDSLLTSFSAFFSLAELYGQDKKIADIVLSNHQLLLRVVTTYSDLKFFLDLFPQKEAAIVDAFSTCPALLYKVVASARSSKAFLWIATKAAAVQPPYRERMLETVLDSLDRFHRADSCQPAASSLYGWARENFPEYTSTWSAYCSFLAATATKGDIIEKSRVLHQAARSPRNVFQKLEGCAAVIAHIVAYTANSDYCTLQIASSLAYDHYNRPRTRVSQPKHYSLFRPSASHRPMLEIVAAAPLKP